MLVAADMLSDVFIPMLEDLNSTNDPIEEYLTGLRLLAGVADDVEVVIRPSTWGRRVRTELGATRRLVHA